MNKKYVMTFFLSFVNKISVCLSASLSEIEVQQFYFSKWLMALKLL